MRRNQIAFVAFQEQDNLGVGYLASVALQAGYDPMLIDFRLGPEAIIEHLRRRDPLVVGFSIIFQYHIAQFRELIDSLRRAGIDCHFCAGGHYPSLRARELLEFIPELDSIVLFEGEHTFLELVERLHAGQDWRDVQGLAHRVDGEFRSNPLRPLETDLDRFPPPVRPPLKEYALGKKYATLLAGRGCLYDCTFCSIRQFYSQPPGPLKRVRRPRMVVREMELLHEQKECSVFMFQDDDFPAGTGRGRAWAQEFCDCLEEAGVSREVSWKINCRPDEVEPALFRRMRDCGLFLVYLGIESGNDQGLSLMNKHMSAETSLAAVDTLKDLGILYDFGFMLFDPESTFATITDNLDFLGRLCADGSSPITFCKMLPYAETDIERTLRQQGRLKTKPGCEDYDFRDGRLTRYFEALSGAFEDWIARRDGLLTRCRWARYHAAIYERYFATDGEADTVREQIATIVAAGNRFFLETARSAAELCQQPGAAGGGFEQDLRKHVASAHHGFNRQLDEAVERLYAAAAVA
jgi:radical SAM superfamily enzyme YgiQ (UPF0313 family)